MTSYCTVFLAGFFGVFFGGGPYPEAFEVWGIATLLAIISGFLPFLFFLYGVKKIGAGRTVIISSIGPAFTVLWAYILLGERLETIQISGMAMIVLGVMVLKLKNPLRLMAGSGGGKQKVEEVIKQGSSDKRLFAFIYVPGPSNFPRAAFAPERPAKAVDACSPVMERCKK